MATLTLTFDTGSIPLATITDALADSHQYQATINGSPNPQTKAQFARQVVQDFVTRTVTDYLREQAKTAAANGVTPITLT